MISHLQTRTYHSPLLWPLLLILLLITSRVSHAADTRITINGVGFDVELAITQEEQSQGLMGRTNLEKGTGMLFVYSDPRELSFWMKETLIPLDILFFDHNSTLIKLFSKVPPCKKDPCKTYSTPSPALYVLELPAGTAKKIKLKPGDRFLHASPLE